jgi:ribosomal protein L37AE/L43A
MPIDYKKYHLNWKDLIRPLILKRANNCCEFCKVPNYKLILRGFWNGIECYQDADGNIFDAKTSEPIGSDYLGEVSQKNKLIKVVLTISHLDHNIGNNEESNLKALCQKCHLNWDKEHHKESRKRNKGIQSLF